MASSVTTTESTTLSSVFLISGFIPPASAFTATIRRVEWLNCVATPPTLVDGLSACGGDDKPKGIPTPTMLAMDTCILCVSVCDRLVEMLVKDEGDIVLVENTLPVLKFYRWTFLRHTIAALLDLSPDKFCLSNKCLMLSKV